MSSHPNPLIYLRGVSTLDMMYILDFIYHGEVSVAHEELDKFLEVADTLKIRGLVPNNEYRARKRPASPTKHTNRSPLKSSKKPKMHSFKEHSVPSANLNTIPLVPSSYHIKTGASGIIKAENAPSIDPIITSQDYEDSTIAEDNFGNHIDGEDYQHDLEAGHEVDNGTAEEAFVSEGLDEGGSCETSNDDGKQELQESSANAIIEQEKPNRKDKPSVDYFGMSNKEEGKANNHVDGKHYGNTNVRGGSLKGRHMSSSEKVTLVNLLKTLDHDNILRDYGKRDPGLTQRRKELWDKILPAFNEICGLNCGLRKLQDILHRMKQNPQGNQPAYSLWYEGSESPEKELP